MPSKYSSGKSFSCRRADTGMRTVWACLSIGLVPLGYEVRDRQLVINPAEAETVRQIFQRYCELGSVRLLKNELDQRGIRSKLRGAKNGARSGGQSFSRGALYTLLEGSGFELTEPFENLKGKAQSECPLSAHSQLLQRNLP
jgi:hypothetical protein